MIILSIIAFIIILALLVLVHEWGHFKAARKFGIRVDEFGFGFPPKIFGKKVGDTEYTLNWIPLGGFVKIFGEDRDGEGKPDSFISKPVWQRMIVILAGVFMNFVLAVFLLTIGFLYGVPQAVNDENIERARDVGVVIVAVAPNSPAQEAGLNIGDSIKSMSFGDTFIEVSTLESMQNFIEDNKGKEISFSVKRGDEILNLNITPRIEAPKDEGAMGVALSMVGIVSSSWYIAPWEGLKTAVMMTMSFVVAFYDLIKSLIFTGSVSADIAGPLGIGQMTYQFTQLGLSYLIQFAAILSLNLAIINLLPIPALDGGRFLFLLVEAVKGSPVSKKIELGFQTAGVVFLILLMILVTIKDIIRIF